MASKHMHTIDVRVGKGKDEKNKNYKNYKTKLFDSLLNDQGRGRQEAIARV